MLECTGVRRVAGDPREGELSRRASTCGLPDLLDRGVQLLGRLPERTVELRTVVFIRLYQPPGPLEPPTDRRDTVSAHSLRVRGAGGPAVVDSRDATHRLCGERVVLEEKADFETTEIEDGALGEGGAASMVGDGGEAPIEGQFAILLQEICERPLVELVIGRAEHAASFPAPGRRQVNVAHGGGPSCGERQVGEIDMAMPMAYSRSPNLIVMVLVKRLIRSNCSRATRDCQAQTSLTLKQWRCHFGCKPTVLAPRRSCKALFQMEHEATGQRIYDLI